MRNLFRIFVRLELIIILISIAVGIYAYYPTFVNKYIIADDARVSYFWAAKIHDKELFNNDLLTQESLNRYPWGYIFLFYLSSLFIDPIMCGTILSIFLLAVCGYYLFKIGELLSGKFLGVITALSFITTQTYIARMAGGLARSFGYPLMIMFLFYLIKKDYRKASIGMILQCLFYPMLFLISSLVFFFSFLKLPFLNRLDLNTVSEKKYKFWDKFSFYLNRLRIFDAPSDKIKCFIVGFLICATIICCKQFLFKNPDMGSVYTKSEMVKMPEFYRGLGKWSDGLPTRSVISEIEPNIMESNAFLTIIIKFCLKIFKKNTVLVIRIFTLFVFLFFFAEILRKKIKLPKEMIILPLVGILLYKLADIFLFRLYVPNRYLIYSAQITALLIFPMVINDLLLKLHNKKIRIIFQFIILVLLLLSFKLYRPTYLMNATRNKPLYEYLNTLPKNTIIAGNPFIADGIPLYSKRKVFLDDESSVALYKKYWETMKKRLFGFYNFYYGDDPIHMFRFCEVNGIEYIVVKMEDFSEKYLKRKSFYSEPFNSFITYIVSKRKDFVLDEIPDNLKLFKNGDVFVIHKNALLLLAK